MREFRLAREWHDRLEEYLLHFIAAAEGFRIAEHIRALDRQVICQLYRGLLAISRSESHGDWPRPCGERLALHVRFDGVLLVINGGPLVAVEIVDRFLRSGAQTEHVQWNTAIPRIRERGAASDRASRNARGISGRRNYRIGGEIDVAER